jgi:hypothetical protein
MNRFKVLSMSSVDTLPMTNSIRRKMELEKLEKRKAEIEGFINENNEILEKIGKALNDLQERANQLVADRNKTIDSQKVNYGALGEVNQWIEGVKKNEIKTETTEDNPDNKTVDINSKKKK